MVIAKIKSLNLNFRMFIKHSCKIKSSKQNIIGLHVKNSRLYCGKLHLVLHTLFPLSKIKTSKPDNLI